MYKYNETLRNPIAIKSSIFMRVVLILVGLNLICFFTTFGQTDKKDSVVEKSKPRISLVGTQLNADSILLETSVKVKRDGSWQPVDYEAVTFSIGADTLTKPLGQALTSDKGIASLKVGIGQLVTGEDGLWNFGSVFGGNANVSEGDAELAIKRIGSGMTAEKKDTTYSLTFKLFVPGPDSLPLPDIEVGFYVKRHFSNLKIGEGTTDENGEASIECPKDLPGDAMGDLVLIGRADDLEEYGSVSASIVKDWGTPIHNSDQVTSRSLSSHAPPLWMVIVFAILMTTVWGHYFVIIYKLVKIRNL